jgi:hypothetical protein
MNKFFDKLPLGKAIPFTKQIVCVFAVVLLAACFGGSKSDKGAPSSAASSASSEVQAVPAQTTNSGTANPESDFEVTLHSSGTGVIIRNYVGTSNTVRIPANIQGLPVYTIWTTAFQTKNITSVVIPEGVLYIAENTFEDCKSLSSVTLPSTLLLIQALAFQGCKTLKTINLPAGLEELDDAVFLRSGLSSFPNPWPANITTIPLSTFFETKLQGSLVIPEGITSIESNAFYHCEELTSVTLPSTIKQIGNNAFQNCSNLTTVNIPESVAKIDFVDQYFGRSFSLCPKLSIASQAALRQRGYDF